MAGEVVAKVASVAFFIAIARELGQGTFGDFVFGLSLSTVVLYAAAFGADELLARNVAREKALVHHMLVNVLAVRSLLVIALIAGVLGIVTIGGYPFETRVAVGLIAVGVGIELLTGAVQAVFQAYEQQKYTSVTLIVQRCFVAGVGVAVLLLGGTLIAVSGVFAVGALVGLLTAFALLRWRVARASVRVDTRLWGTLVRAGAPLGIAALLFTVLLKLDAALLGFLKDSVEVGNYGAAFRLVEATMFLSWAMSGAMLPWFSRQVRDAPVPLWRSYELGLKAITLVLLPIAIIYTAYAGPLIDLIYGQQYDDAVVPLQILGPMTVLYGMNVYAVIVLISRDRPGEFSRPAAVILLQNVVFNLILIPRYGAEGAAFNAVLSGVLLAGAAFWVVGKVMGPYSLTQALVPPIAAGAVMAGVILLGGFTIPAAVAGLAAYAACFALIERVVFVEDFDLYARILRAARGRGMGARTVPHELGS